MEASIQIDRKVQWAGAAIGLVLVALYAATGIGPILALPFGLLFVALMVVNWRAAWWIFLFSVPLSQQIFMLNGQLSTSLPDEPLMWLFLLTLILMVAARPKLLPEWFLRS